MSDTIICCWCQRETPRVKTCKHCERAAMLNDTWALIEMIGHGASGHTWRAEHIETGRVVAIKELSFRRLTEFKQLELFEREAALLERLDHPGIPTYEEDFVVEDDRHISFYLVQEYIPGEALDDAGTTHEDEVRELMLEMVDVLKYLRSQRPPVIHRDIKPANIMRRPDGSYVLIDFGSTRTAVGQTTGGSTVAGTLGYMAPEQLMGRATPCSDVYGLAATAVALLAGRDASQVLDPHHKGQWAKNVAVSRGLGVLLEEMLDVDEAKRLDDLDAIRDRLDAAPEEDARQKRVERPKTSPRRERSGRIKAHELQERVPDRNENGGKRSWRDTLIDVGRDPIGESLIILVIAAAYLPFAVVVSFVSRYVMSDTLHKMIFEAPNPMIMWPIFSVMLYIVFVAIGRWLDRDGPREYTVTSFRKIRKGLRRTWRANVSTRIAILLLFGTLFVVLFGKVWQWYTGSFVNGAVFASALIAIEQLTAHFTNRNSWRRAFGHEFDEVWPKQSELRAQFKDLANRLWCGVPSFFASNQAHRAFEDAYRELLNLRCSANDRQCEHIDLVRMVCQASRPSQSSHLDESIARLDEMEPGRTTAEALLAAIDEAHNDHLARELASHYLAHRSVSRESARLSS